jgi:hypothetical protein
VGTRTGPRKPAQDRGSPRSWRFGKNTPAIIDISVTLTRTIPIGNIYAVKPLHLLFFTTEGSLELPTPASEACTGTAWLRQAEEGHVDQISESINTYKPRRKSEQR